MKKLIALLLLSFCIINSNYVKAQCYIDPELQEILEQKSDELVSINIILKSQINVAKLDSKKHIYRDRASKKDATLKEFKQFSEASQADILSILQAETRSNNVKDIKCHWITNMINCTVTNDVVYQLSTHPDIEAIVYNKKQYMLFDEEAQEAKATRGMTENIKMVKASEAWDLGYTGKDILVSILDTGVNINHIDLSDHLWDGGEEYPNHGYNTYDNNHDVIDRYGHGTHCAGTICGDGTSGTQSGVAPDATLMVIKVLGDEGYGSLEAIISGVEFSVEHGADLLSLSLGASFSNTYTDGVYRSTFENLLSFDIIAAVAAGNDRTKLIEYPIPRNINAPANCPPAWIHPDQQANFGGTSSIICVGAVDYNDKHAYFSSEGPVTWSGTPWGDYILDMSSELESGWLDYDNNIYDTCIGISYWFKWGVMFPPSKLMKYENAELTKVAMYDRVAHNGEIEIYQGGQTPNEGTLLHTQSYSCTGANDFVEFDLNTPLNIDKTENLWIILNSADGYLKPAAACKSIHEPNGRWVGTTHNGYTTWSDICDDYGKQNTWMIRAFISDNAGTVASLDLEENTEFGLIRPDVCAPGYQIVSASHSSNFGHAILNGTSMATPCVAGTIALMLDKNPDLTPAMICETLETTAVKLSDKKNNQTGSGRIDVLAAMEYIDGFTSTCLAPSNLTAEALTYNSVVLSWEASSTANEYEVFRNDEKIATIDSTLYTDMQLENNTEYCYTVKSVCNTGISDPSNEACITTSNNENINERNTHFNIYPNPANDMLNIEADVEIEKVLIYDVYGKTQNIKNSESQKFDNTVDISDLNSGVYFIKITTDKGETTKLFIKK